MNPDEAVQECAACAMQIKRYDPDPHYTGYYFGRYIRAVNLAIDGIFAEADIDFGLFTGGSITQEIFADSLKRRGDQSAAAFLKWYEDRYPEWHSGAYPQMMDVVRRVTNMTGHKVEIEIMIRAADRYKDDPVHHLGAGLTRNGRLRSEMELDVAVRRNTALFVEVINHKRRSRDEPVTDARRLVTSTFAVINAPSTHESSAGMSTLGAESSGALTRIGTPPQIVMELAYSTEIYIQVIKRIVEESRQEILSITSRR